MWGWEVDFEGLLALAIRKQINLPCGPCGLQYTQLGFPPMTHGQHKSLKFGGFLLRGTQSFHQYIALKNPHALHALIEILRCSSHHRT